MNVWAWVAFLGIQIMSGFLIGITSFGGNLFSIPLLAMFMHPREAIVIVSLSSIPIFVGAGLIYWRHLPWLELCLLLVCALPGAPCGAWLLANSGVAALLLGAGSAVAIFLIWQFVSLRLQRRPTSMSIWLALPCGFIGGIMATALGMNGPPAIIYAFLRRWDKEQTLSGCSMVIGLQILLGMPAQWRIGLYTEPILKLAFLAVIFALLGLAISVPCLKRVNVSLFRKLVLAMLALSAFNLLIRGLTAL